MYNWNCPHCNNKRIENTNPNVILRLANEHAEICSETPRCHECNRAFKYNEENRIKTLSDGSKQIYHVDCIKDDVCSYCNRKTNTIHKIKNKTEVSCSDCISELHKPSDYNNAMISCRCGKVSKHAWTWTGEAWECHPNIPYVASCCAEEKIESISTTNISSTQSTSFDSFSSLTSGNRGDYDSFISASISEINERREQEQRATQARLQDELEKLETKNLQEQPPKK